MALAMSRPWKHPKTGVYWLRKAVPADLRVAVGKREEKVSLKTKEPAEAKRLHAAALAAVEERWANLRVPVRRLDDADLRRAAELVCQARLDGKIADDPFWTGELADSLWRLENDTPDLMRGSLAFDEAALSRNIARQYHQDWCRSVAKDFLKGQGLSVDEQSELDLAKAISLGRRRAESVLEQRRNGDFGQTLIASVPTNAIVSPTSASVTTPVTLQSLLDGWSTEKRPVAKTVYMWQRVIDQVAAFVGHKDATRLSADDLLRWKAALIESGLRTKTIRDSKIAPLRAILQWGVDNRKIATNPASRIVIDVRTRVAERRRGYTDDEAALILANAARSTEAVKKWAPLLCAYSGARISEVCQLRTEDIIQIGGIWCMKFDPAAGSLKTDSSERAVPLHPAITDAGFLGFVKSVRRGALFADLAADRFGNRGGTGTKVIGKWVRSLGLNDARLSPSHSWRHRFKTLGRQHGLAPDIVNAITGHHRKTVADSYGEFPIDALHRELSKIPKLIGSIREQSSSLSLTKDGG